MGKIDFNKTIGVICEVKTGKYEVKKLFRPQYVKYSIGRMGIVPKDSIASLSDTLNNVPLIETDEGNIICKLLIADKSIQQQKFIYLSLEYVRNFIINRVKKYPIEKYADRMFFKSNLFQDTIDRIYR